MTKLRTVLSRVLGLLGQRRRDADLTDEIQAHLDQLAEDHVRRGLSPVEARAAARREFGGVDQVKETYRDQRGIPFVDTLVQDVRYAGRILLANRASTAVVVLTLAVAIGASTIVFSTIDAILQSLPIRDRSRVVHLASTDPRSLVRVGVSAPDLADWTLATTSFEALAALAFGSLNLSGVDVPVRVSTIRMTANLLPMWGVEPVLGRSLRPDEDRPGGPRAVLLSNRFWQGQFKGDRAILGRTVTLDRAPYTVVGVLPPDMDRGVFRLTDIWVPLALDPARSRRDNRELLVTGLLKPAVSLEQGEAEIQTIARRLETEHPDTNTGTGALALPVIEMFGLSSVRFVVALMSGVAVFTLLVACANVANIVLARTTSRGRELALRAALGASRLRLIRQLMVESVVWSLLACAGGVLLAFWGVAAVRAIAGSDAIIFADMAINRRVLALALLAALGAPFLFALIPAIRSVALDVRRGLTQGERLATDGRRGRRLRGVLVGCQVSLALMMLVEVGLLTETALAFRERERGFDPRNVLTLHLDLPASRYVEPRQIRSFFAEMLGRIERLPGVRSAGVVSRLPVFDREVTLRFSIDGQPVQTPGTEPSAARAIVSAGYREAMGIPLVAGRDFGIADEADRAPVALINDLMARRHWPNESPLGKRIRFQDSWLEVVGVVGNVRNSDVDAVPLSQVYLPLAQFPEASMAVVVRAESSRPADLGPAIRAQVADLDRDQPIYDVLTMEQVLFDDLSGLYVIVGILATMASIAVGLAASGIYGVICYGVAQRTRELGIRMAFGAEPRALMRMVLAQASVPVMAGGAVGLAGGVALARVTTQALGDVFGARASTYLAVTVLLAVVALAASYVPARRALRVDPMVALRHE